MCVCVCLCENVKQTLKTMNEARSEADNEYWMKENNNN